MKKCSSCGASLPDFSAVCSVCGGAAVEVVDVVNVATPNMAVGATPIKQRVRIRWWMILVAVIVLLGGLAGAGVATNWFGMVAPTQKLGNAITKTVHADSFTVEYRFRNSSSDKVITEKGTAKVMMDKSKKEISYYFAGDGGLGYFGDDTTLYVDGSEYCYYAPEDDYRGYASIREDANFDKEFFKIYNAIVQDGKIDWAEVVKKAGLESYINKSQIEAFVQEVAETCLKDKEWLEDNLGFEKDGNTYVFKIDIDQLGESIVDMCNDSKAFKKATKDAIEDMVNSFVEEANDADGRITVTMKTDGGYLSYICVELKDAEGERAMYEVTIRNVNNTVLSKGEINDVKENAQKLLAENACVSCGKEWGDYEGEEGYLCSDCHRTCDVCGEVSEWRLNDVGDQRLCDDCYDTCASCGEDTAAYERDGQRLCNDCYYKCTSCGGTDAYYERDGKQVCYNCRYVCEKCKETCSNTYDYGGLSVCSDCYTCESCGGSSPSYTLDGKQVCYTCYYKCTSCGATSASYERDGKRVCYDCRYVCDKCKKPCGYVYEYDDLEVCDDCFVCESCGDNSPSYELDGKHVCYTCYYKCTSCGATSASYERDGKRVCYDCRYICGKCKEPCGDTNDYGGLEVCDDCFVCSSCGESYPSYERDGIPVCYECRYECEKCEKACGSTYTLDGQSVCSDCYYTCDNCGEVSDWSLNDVGDERWCDDCYVCSSCGDSSPYYERDGKLVCYECRYECEKCKKACGSLYTRNDQEVCENCYYTCDKCGGVSDWSLNDVGDEQWCDDCYVCSSCGNSYPDYERDGKPVCYDCRYVCDKCGEACSDTNTVGEEEWCDDCFVCAECGDTWPDYERDGLPVCYDCYWGY